MKLQSLKPASGSTHNSKRLGRGQGSGKGGTSAKGHKGQKARAGYSRKIGFEGGQMPLQRRLPKFGFTNVNRKEYKGINVDTIQLLITDNNLTGEINKDTFVQFGLASKNELVKVLGRGEITSSVTVKADKFTKTAIAAIEKAGGKTESN